MNLALWPVVAMLAGLPQEPVDRTTVGGTQVEVTRMRVASFGYGRLGYGRVLGAGGSGNPVLGFGYRAELDPFGFDISFFNYQVPSSSGVYGAYAASEYAGGSLLKLEALRFLKPSANASAYVGGGVSWGTVSGHSSPPNNYSSSYSYSSWSGSGLQGELTAGYELPRASELRAFFQVDATMPFYEVYGNTYVYSGGRSSNVALGHRYNPSIAVSVGLGWQRHHN